jgi:hypothetical protein
MLHRAFNKVLQNETTGACQLFIIIHVHTQKVRSKSTLIGVPYCIFFRSWLPHLPLLRYVHISGLYCSDYGGLDCFHHFFLTYNVHIEIGCYRNFF